MKIRNSANGLVVRDGRVLLLRGEWPQPDTYWLPGGGQEPGESLAACVEREVLEETGVRVRAREMLLVRETIPDNHPDGPFPRSGSHRVEMTFWCDIIAEPDVLGGAKPDGPQVDVAWVPVDKLTGLRFLPVWFESRLPALIAHGQKRGVVGVYVGDVA
ncbi:NUDIX domain-containing protein [Streptomyces telluris]|uniref:NUDIX domain-containing protein n=1 Tax=Streptomyces telluris TaxID=2720021 RepID=A0A9X2LKR1_9ACTN|nr:NUDIX domain-containing protein [Streptomyces telluris]MCQ8773119.1 NUDIX domain-containing protein [Streptomyces telluris]NJP80541.1 NUDIX domain-containing protein [Streptomyces telluris]